MMHAVTTGPASGPRPTSSMPATRTFCAQSAFSYSVMRSRRSRSVSRGIFVTSVRKNQARASALSRRGAYRPQRFWPEMNRLFCAAGSSEFCTKPAHYKLFPRDTSVTLAGTACTLRKTSSNGSFKDASAMRDCRADISAGFCSPYAIHREQSIQPAMRQLAFRLTALIGRPPLRPALGGA